MKKFVVLTFVLLLIVSATGKTETLSKDQQKELIEAYVYVTGKGVSEKAGKARKKLAADYKDVPVKCGTPAVSEFKLNYNQLDKELLKDYALDQDSVLTRPILSDSIGSPSGLFMIHYTTTGTDAAYQSGVQTGGVPDFILKVADIFDSVYIKTIVDLGYPSPPNDGFYPTGGDNKFDVYVRDFGGAVFGQTSIDSIDVDGPNTLRATAFMEIDNDFAEISIYANRPLDAVRVTAAHEYFHVVQFGIDFREQEDQRRYWMEMSATFMEEVQYDQINDYYGYLPFYYNAPNASLQRFNGFLDLHPYASVVYPIFLSENYGPEIVRDIWLRCAENVGDDFLRVTQDVIDSASGGTENFHTMFSKFATWNYFTGNPRAALAPAGIGYSEAASYDAIPNSEMAIHNVYPVLVTKPGNPFNPDHNATIYINFNELSAIRHDTTFWNCNNYSFEPCTDSSIVPDPITNPYDFVNIDDTTFWQCNSGIFPNCTDSTLLPDNDPSWDFIHIDSSFWNCNNGTTQICIDSTVVADTSLGYDIVGIDSSFAIAVSFDNTFVQPWGLSIIYQDAIDLDLYEVENILLPGATQHLLKIPQPYKYRSIVTAFTPASPFGGNYSPNRPIEMAYFVISTGDVDSNYVNKPSAVLYPYPNPAVVSNMIDDSVYFRFQLETNETSYPSRCADSLRVNNPISDPFDFIFIDSNYYVCTDSAGSLCIDSIIVPQSFTNSWLVADTSYWNCLSNFSELSGPTAVYMIVDIYSLSGERVKTIATNAANEFQGSYSHGDRVIGWNMANESGELVSSGVYIAYARMFTSEKTGKFIAEAKAKLAIIR